MFDELNEIINANLLRMFAQLCTYSTLRWKKRTSRKKGLRVKSSEANMFKVPILTTVTRYGTKIT